MKPQVLVLGDVNVDLVIPLDERSVEISNPGNPGVTLYGGGTAANTAVGLARLGEQVTFIGTVGDDSYGRWVVNDLAQEGIDTREIRFVPDVFTSMVVALIHPDGDRSIYVWPDKGGAHTTLEPGDIKSEIIQQFSWLHVTGLCLREEPVRQAQLIAMKMASEKGLTVSLDLNLRLESWGMDRSLKAVFEEAISYSGVVFGNGEEEIIPLTGEASIQAGAEMISEGKRIVIARRGSDGAMVVAPGKSFDLPAYSVKIVDTLGAGDAFNAGYIAARLAKKDLAEAVHWGNAAAALKVGKPGARGLPSLEELTSFLE